MNKTKTKRFLTVLLIFVLCLSFAVPGLARRRWYSYDNGEGGLFWTTTWYPDCFAAFLGITGAGVIPVFDATAFAEQVKMLAEFQKITQSIQDLFGLRKQRLGTELDIEVEKLAKVKLPETARDKDSREPGKLYSGETILAPEVKPEDTVIRMRVDHFDALTIPGDIGYGMSLHNTVAMDDHMATTRSTMKAMDDINSQVSEVSGKEPEGIVGAMQQGIVISKLSGSMEEARGYNRMADLALDTVELETERILTETADKHIAGMMTFRVIDPLNPSEGEKKILEEGREKGKIRTKNLGWKKF